jgi:hypothetical protein
MNTKSKSSPAIDVWILYDHFKDYPLESFCVTPNFPKYLESVLIPGGFIEDSLHLSYYLINQSFDEIIVVQIQ